ncbi:MAG: excalibur calcium-binding domain-containing protein [Actinomycetales bacterium]|nr:MAG: excalibur calcium-binding domain-containing protein [Actinomycetales bacterium]
MTPTENVRSKNFRWRRAAGTRARLQLAGLGRCGIVVYDSWYLISPSASTVGAAPATTTVGVAPPASPSSRHPPAPIHTAPQSSVSYTSCADAKAADAAPNYQGEPGYSTKLDRDKDGDKWSRNIGSTPSWIAAIPACFR